MKECILYNESKRYFKLGNLPEPQCCSAGAALLCVQEHVQNEPWLQAESDASWELHDEDSGHLAGWEWILDRVHVLLRPGLK